MGGLEIGFGEDGKKIEIYFLYISIGISITMFLFHLLYTLFIIKICLSISKDFFFHKILFVIRYPASSLSLRFNKLTKVLTK